MLFLAYYLVFQYSTNAISVSPPMEQLECLPASAATSTRSLFNIVLSCVSTTVICAWVSVHPNVPPRSKIFAFSRRVWLLLWTIIAPELVLAWAVRQRYAARMVQKEFEDHGWTETHGHFLNMGGFTLINGTTNQEPREPEKPNWLYHRYFLDFDVMYWSWTPLSWPLYDLQRQYDFESQRQKYNDEYRCYNLGPVSFETFKELLANSEIDFPTITKADIEDRSKGDFLFKALAVVHTTWFILQCAARIPQKLALTELELVTLALASLNAITYYFWWNKPLQVQEPVKLSLKNTRALVEREADDHSDSPTVEEVLTTIHEVVQEFGSSLWIFLRNPCKHGALAAIVFIFVGIPLRLIIFCCLVFPLTVIGLLSIPSIDHIPNRSYPHQVAAQSLSDVRLALTKFIHDFFTKRLNGGSGEDVGEVIAALILFPLICIILIVLILFLVSFLLLIPFLFNSIFDITTTNSIPPGARHVPAFYAPRTDSDRYSRMLVFAFFGVIFGGLHIIGFIFEFPTSFERTLWRVASVTITLIPFIAAPIDFLIERKSVSSRLPEMFLSVLMTILLFIYVPVRLSLIFQAIVLLRHQPPSAFVAVDWTTFIPHFVML